MASFDFSSCEGKMGPMDAPIPFENFTPEIRNLVKERTGCVVSWRPRKQWGKKQLTVHGPPSMLATALQLACEMVEFLNSRAAMPVPPPPPLPPPPGPPPPSPQARKRRRSRDRAEEARPKPSIKRAPKSSTKSAQIKSKPPPPSAPASKRQFIYSRVAHSAGRDYCEGDLGEHISQARREIWESGFRQRGW